MNRTLNMLIATFMAAISLFLWNCQENPLPIALEDRNSQIVIDTLYARFDTTYALNKTISTLDSDRLLIGSSYGFSFRPILRFSMHTIPDSAVIDSLWIRLVSLQAGGEELSEFAAMGYQVLGIWQTDTDYLWQHYPARVNLTNPMGYLRVTTAKNDTLYFNFTGYGKEVIRTWIDSTRANRGMVLDFNHATFIKEFKARDSFTQTGVHLFIRYTAGSDTVMKTDSLLAITDGFLFKGSFPALAGRNQVSSLYPWVTLLDFDLDSLKRKYPNGFVVTSANLQLPLDRANTIPHGGSGPDLQILPLLEGFSQQDSLEVDSSFIGITTRVIEINRYSTDSSFVEVTEGNDRRELAATYIQRKLNFPDSYQGFFVEHKFRASYLARFSFFKHNFADPNRRPRLILYSLRFPDERL